jgi:hypothetical protein
MSQDSSNTNHKDEQQLLRDARAKAQKLIAQLLAQQEDLDRFSSQQQIVLSPEQLAQGKQAFAQAIESTRKTLQGIDAALEQTSVKHRS